EERADMSLLSRHARGFALASAIMLLAGCNAAERIASIGKAPDLSAIDSHAGVAAHEPVLLPMPRPEPMVRQPNSLWRPGSRAFFKDQRASRVGDILTVNITIDDEATIDNETTRTRSSAED